MKKLKNWFIGFKTIKGGAAGLINIADYIYNDKHKNHIKHGHEIVAFELDRSEKILQNILHIQQSKENETLLKRKGGRPASYGKSLLVSFPPEIKLSDEAYRLLKDKLVDKFIKFISDNNNLNYTTEQIAYTKRSFILSSVHKQKNNNDHLNIIIPNVFLDLNKNKSLKRVDLGKKMYSHFLKTITNSLLLNMGHNYLDYQIKRQRNNKNHVKNGHEIVAFEAGNSEKILQNILHVQQSKENETLIQRKGGRPASFGKSLLVSFPPEIKLSNEVYKAIKDKLVDQLIEFISDNNNLNYTPEQVAYFKRSFVLSSVHKQKNGNDHLNIIIPNVFLDLNKNKVLKRVDLGKKMYSHFLKTMTNSLLLNMGHNYLDYQIKRQRNNKNHKNKLSYTIEQLQEVFKEMDFLKDISAKLEKRITIYMQRMQSAIDEKNE